ncbi:hypothetical protein L1987_65010 [Smallanthus sonchifolius]|uniref:Uncharacterized protein n=1 Tax=Smallanthus sonchifolius TaxID=185202 RepID=A0ACB9BTD1_9ASTR|nr:hypothetical protein L1987_65010 [Smallanthus sonchifolius]
MIFLHGLMYYIVLKRFLSFKPFHRHRRLQPSYVIFFSLRLILPTNLHRHLQPSSHEPETHPASAIFLEVKNVYRASSGSYSALEEASSSFRCDKVEYCRCTM